MRQWVYKMEWHGRFTSTQYTTLFGCVPLVAGSISVTLPEDWRQVDTEARLEYGALYRRGQVTTFSFKASPEGGGGSQAGVAVIRGKPLAGPTR